MNGSSCFYFRRPYITRFCVGEMGEVEGEMVAGGSEGGKMRVERESENGVSGVR